MAFYSHPVHLVLGLIIWSVWFVLIYALLSVGCTASHGAGASIWINILLLCCTLLFLTLLSYLAYRYWQKNKVAYEKKTLRRFIIWVSLGVYLVAIGATFSIGIMVLFFPPCI